MQRKIYYILTLTCLLTITNLQADRQAIPGIPDDPQVQVLFDSFTTQLDSAHYLHQQGEYEKAVRLYATSFDQLKQFNEKRREHTATYLAEFYETGQKEQQLTFLDQTLQLKKKQRLLLILLCTTFLTTLTLAFLFLKYRLHTIRHRAGQKENEARLIKLEKEKHQLEARVHTMEVEKYQKELLAESLLVNHKNKVLDDLRLFFMQNPDLTPYKEELESILQKELIPTGNTALQTGIDHIHPIFYTRLQEQAGHKLTTLDLEYCRMIYLNLTSKEMARILQVDPNTIRTTKYRLKQKLNLSKAEDLTSFIQQTANNHSSTDS